ncbi:helix-turn-helix transcriptional regulator [uncultured Pelagimonas sp.]|uniref:helix-turn-helix transcriptional regulator n=1 Tax=uncultured Pelagimonas sp. TaxID=1618102 RepID=UPI00260832CD|nr:helix-turn-helix transcriptional regulator [uncultured Pelagimonas sp.]
MPQKLDANLIKYRLLSEANLSLKDLAKKLKRDPSTISMVIHGRRKSAPIMQAIADILDPTLSETPDDGTTVDVENKEDAA